jgi:mTERF domain-containing protein
MNVLDHQMKELENYRAAVQRMGQDILALRQQIRELEANNSQLRRDLANYNDASKLMIDSSELDNLTKPEVMSRYGKGQRSNIAK